MKGKHIFLRGLASHLHKNPDFIKENIGKIPVQLVPLQVIIHLFLKVCRGLVHH